MDIVEFLRARLDVDETMARDASAEAGGPEWSAQEAWVEQDNGGGGWEVVAGPAVIRGGMAPSANFIARHDPARVLRETEAKRRIVDLVAPVVNDPYNEWAFGVLELLAAIDDQHPDYRPEWKP